MTPHLYRLSSGARTEPGATYVVEPTQWAGGPWSATSQHGGPVNALCASAIAPHVAETGWVVNRLTIDLLKPVPMALLGVSTHVRRRGRRMMVVDVDITTTTSGDVVATARAVIKQPSDDSAPGLGVFDGADRSNATPRSELATQPFIDTEQLPLLPPGFHSSVELQISEHPADLTAWLSSSVRHMFDGQACAPLETLAALADLTTVISGRLLLLGSTETPPSMAFMNTDTTVQLARRPSGRHVGFTEPTLLLTGGVGVSSVLLHDERGLIGRASQSVISVSA